MKVDTAERLTELALGMSDELNEMVRDIQANEPHNEFVRLQQAIGRVMWAILFRDPDTDIRGRPFARARGSDDG